MPAESAAFSDAETPTLAGLEALRRFEGPPKDFWPRYLTGLARLLAAHHVVLLVRDGGDGDGDREGKGWRKLADWTAPHGPIRHSATFHSQVPDAAQRCFESGPLAQTLNGAPADGAAPYILGRRLRLLREQDTCVAVALLPESNAGQAREALLRLALAADVPASYQEHQAAQQASHDVEKFATALDLVAQVNTPHKFLAAAMALCNGLATRFHCDRVSLGWLERNRIRLRAISRTENFNRRMEAAQKLEVAMEEALDQDDEVIWPAPPESSVVTRDHDTYATDQRVQHVCSLPLRVKDKPVAVLTGERQEGPFTEAELQQLRLCCDLVAPRLADLKHRDRWFGARWATTVREQLAALVGPEHTWAKVLACTGALLLALLFFLKLPYRVEGNFVLRSDEVAYLTAPFDGYLDRVHVRPGDLVTNGQPLLRFKTSELELQESAALADLNRYQREAEKARAANSLAEMRIAQALADQARARLDVVRYRLDQAVIRAPFDGYVVEGDLRDRLGAPVKEADVLFQIARTDRLYIEAEINERDIHELLGHTHGEMAFVSQPKLKFPIQATTLEQAAFPKDQENVFLVRCEPVDAPQPWWRPGMSGLTKFDIEPRPLIWIITHRTVDFLRMWLWW